MTNHRNGLILALVAMLVPAGALALGNDDHPTHARISMGLYPAELRLAPGETANVTVYAGAMNETTLQLSASDAPNVTVAFAQAALALPASEKTKTILTVTASAPGNYVVMVRGTEPDGATIQRPLALHVRAAEPAYHRPEPSAPAKPPTPTNRARPSWGLGWEPREISARPGEDVNAMLVLRSYHDITANLSLRVPDGVTAILSADSARIDAGGHARVPVKIHIGENASGAYTILADAGSNATAEKHDARLVIHVARPAAPVPADKPTEKPATPSDQDVFLAALRAYLSHHHMGGKRVVIMIMDEGVHMETVAPGSSA